MLDCKHKICCWPECNKTCGLVPASDYPVGASEEEELIYHLQDEIAKRDKLIKNVYRILTNVKTDIFKDLIPLEEALEVTTADYEPACPLNYTDCLNDPGWLKFWDYDEWKKSGCPEVCHHYKDDGTGYLCAGYYNPEEDM